MDIDPRQQLRTKIEALPGGFAEAAEKLGCTSAWLYILCAKPKGKRRRKQKNLSLDLIGKVQDLFGIPVDAWIPHAKSRAA